jgi:hypothetical protein
MFGNWFKRKMQLKAVQTHTEDIRRFVAMLKGVTDEEMGTFVVVATTVRLSAARSGCDWEKLMEAVVEDRIALCQTAIDLGNAIREAQRDPATHPVATGLMVWLHSVRAYVCPEIRYLGQEMWRELQRGMPHTLDPYESFHALGMPDLTPETLARAEYVPTHLKPFRATSQA